MPFGGWMTSFFALLAFHCYLQLLGRGSSEALYFWEGRERQKEYGRRETKGRDGEKSHAMELCPSWWHLNRNVTVRETISK